MSQKLYKHGVPDPALQPRAASPADNDLREAQMQQGRNAHCRFCLSTKKETAPEGRLRRLLVELRVFLAETIDAACRIEKFLLAGIERMAGRANLNLNVVTLGRAGLDDIAAMALDLDRLVFGMDSFSHDFFSFIALAWYRA
jgi:hypothetical protein